MVARFLIAQHANAVKLIFVLKDRRINYCKLEYNYKMIWFFIKAWLKEFNRFLKLIDQNYLEKFYLEQKFINNQIFDFINA